MRGLFVSATLVAALVAATPASAQRASLADRVAVLEQRAGDNQANMALLNEVNQLKAEVRALRAQVEELQQLTQQLQESGKRQYLDIDDRLNRLEVGGAPAVPATPPKGSTPGAKPAAQPVSAAVPAPAERAPSVHGDAGKLREGAGERAAYDAAFATLKAGRYADASSQFLAFLQQHPNGVYTPNALYWLGESYYVTQNYEPALEQFQALVDRYPTHDKAPGALLKVGLAQQGLKRLDAAERTFGSVVARYPDTDAARVAQDRLRALELGRLGGSR
ncbi:tol-pal system protein YbgF [Lysobacter olei]